MLVAAINFLSITSMREVEQTGSGTVRMSMTTFKHVLWVNTELQVQKAFTSGLYCEMFCGLPKGSSDRNREHK